MRRAVWTATLIALVALAASCARNKQEVTVDRHRVDTEFIVE